MILQVFCTHPVTREIRVSAYTKEFGSRSLECIGCGGQAQSKALLPDKVIAEIKEGGLIADGNQIV